MNHLAWLAGCFLIVFVGSASCQNRAGNPDPLPRDPFPFQPKYSISDLIFSSDFEQIPLNHGDVELDEVSGMGYSRYNPGYVWVHQDSGDDAVVYLLDTIQAEVVASYKLEGFSNRDWEDLEIGPGPDLGKSYIYLAETGDNLQKYGDYALLRFEEPRFNEEHRGKIVSIDQGVDRLAFSYPTKNHDVECLLVDPLTRHIYLVSKRDFLAKVFELPFPQSTDTINEVRDFGTFPFTFITGGSVSEDGLQVAIRTYDRIFYWTRTPTESFSSMLAGIPVLLPHEREQQGEAICFYGNEGFFTLSEKANDKAPKLLFYRKK